MNMKQQPTERLRKVIEVGDTLKLFPLLQDWSTPELKALLHDVDVYNRVVNKQIDAGWAEGALLPEFFFDRGASKQLDAARDDAKMHVMQICSEICSVAIFYLQERGEYVEDPEA